MSEPTREQLISQLTGEQLEQMRARWPTIASALVAGWESVGENYAEAYAAGHDFPYVLATLERAEARIKELSICDSCGRELGRGYCRICDNDD